MYDRWMPKIVLPKPVPLIFANADFDAMLESAIRKNKFINLSKYSNKYNNNNNNSTSKLTANNHNNTEHYQQYVKM
jgi:hypothetical protein